MSLMKDEIEKLKQIEEAARAGGGKKNIDEQHRLGKLTARERIDHLLDPGTFVEVNMLAQHQCADFGMEKNRPWGDGVITGYGKVDGRVVFLYAQDSTVMGGSVGQIHGQKIASLIRMARQASSPAVGLIDSAGGRIQEGSGAYSLIFAENVDSSGIIPQISAILGNCAGGGVYSPALTDFIFMVDKTSQMFITGPLVIKEVTGQEVESQELGGARVHFQTSGVADFVGPDELVCLARVKKLLSFLPSSFTQNPPVIQSEDDPERCEEGLVEILPDSPKKVYDMRRVISLIVDHKDFFEVKAGFARNMVTGFARMNGKPVGIVANNPLFLASAIDCDAADKAARFIRTCDCFNLPLISLVDVPGYLPGIKEEHKGIIRHGAKMLYAWKEATVPKVTCIIRKAYGGAFAAMSNKEMGADLVLAWPTTEIAIMGAEGAVRILFRKEIDAAADKEKVREEKIQEYREKFMTPYYTASKRQLDVLIRPQETRPQIIKGLEMLENKKVSRAERKHGNIPL
ncbi:MAG: methylmalonyl-CoA carboxyltransferase [Deltaproteobacteria bacterium]|nr:methylmalonyl-CoA carboxyltransferase [Deltaproteobacteria bacterium]